MPSLNWRATADDDGLRLDKFLRRELRSIPLSHIYKLLRTRKVKLNGRRVRAGERRLTEGDEIEVWGDPEKLASTAKQVGRGAPTTRREFDVLYEDDELIAVGKPAGLAIHPGTGISGATLVDQVRAHLGVTGEEPGFTASPAHRLDKDTSGVVLVAKSRQVMVALTEAFTQKTIEKTYLAVVKGKMSQRSGEIDLALKERQQTAKSKQMHGANYQQALTRWTLRASVKRASLLEVHPATGRTHQIRRHLEAIGHPLVGDRRYGDFPFNREAKVQWGVSRHLLHAWRLELLHPASGEPMRFEAPSPADFEEALGRIGLRG